MEQNQVQVVQQPQEMSVATQSAFFNPQAFEQLQRVGLMFAQSSLVPAAYQQKSPNDTLAQANCIIALEMANRMQVNPIMVMQNLYIVHGNPGWSSKFLIACLNGCGKFSPLRYEFKGTEGTDDWSCRAYAIDKATNEELKGAWVSIGMAKKEGWYGKNGSKWQTMPELMLQYRAAAFFQRTYAPEISMGLNTAEEYTDEYGSRASVQPKEQVVEPIVEAEVVTEAEQQAAADLFG